MSRKYVTQPTGATTEHQAASFMMKLPGTKSHKMFLIKLFKLYKDFE